MNAVRHSLLFLVATAAYGRGAAEPADPHARVPESRAPWTSPGWQQVEDRLGGITPTGMPRLANVLDDTADLKRLGLRCRLEHHVEIDAGGRPRTRWRMPALRTFLVPEGRDKLLWQPPGGAAVRFDRAGIGRALAEAGPAHWLIRRRATGEFDIRSRNGRGWTYRHGSLTSLSHPGLGHFEVATRGGLVREIRRDGGRTDSRVLHAQFDDAGNCLRLGVGEDRVHFFDWDPDGLLRSWTRPDESTTTFAYRDGLLSEVAEEGKPLRRYVWAENPGWRRGDSRWPAPVHLASDGENDYTYGLTSKGFVIERRETGTGARTVTIFNPRRRRLEQRAGDETLVVTFHRGAGRPGALERIETDRGQIVEDYIYNEQGDLVGVRREGEVELSLSYDESGRLMALMEKEVP